MERRRCHLYWSMDFVHDSGDQNLCDNPRHHYLYFTGDYILLILLIIGLYFTNTVCPETTEERRLEKKELVITLIIASGAFFIGFTPTLVFYTVVASPGDDENIHDNLYYILSNSIDFVFACSLCFNPILYAFRSTNFKEGFKRIILCREPTSANAIY